MIGRYFEKVEKLHEIYQTNLPFPHIVLDDVFAYGGVQDVVKHFPELGPNWWKYSNPLEVKFAQDQLESFHSSIQSLILFMMKNPFMDFLERLTGIEGLIPDHRLNGGGLHQITRGGKLDIHADYNYHPVTQLDRRVNVILYLNEGWQTDWKGQLELWPKDMSACAKRIEPLFNRMVVFSTTDYAYHGHPDPLECPESVTRKSIALYYYSNGRPEHEMSFSHSTLYQKRPQDAHDPEIEALRKKRAIRRLT